MLTRLLVSAIYSFILTLFAMSVLVLFIYIAWVIAYTFSFHIGWMGYLIIGCIVFLYTAIAAFLDEDLHTGTSAIELYD